MKHRTYFQIVAFVFFVVALGHLARVLFGWDLLVETADIPMWASALAVLIIGYLSYKAMVLARDAND